MMATSHSIRDPLFLRRWFEDEVIIVAVRWYLACPLSYRQMCELLRDRGISVPLSTVMRSVLRYTLNSRSAGGGIYGQFGFALSLNNAAKRGDLVLDEHLATVCYLREETISRIDTYLSDVPTADAFFA
jgi:hypothetical protein